MTDMPWSLWVADQMRRCGYETQADVVRATGIDRSVISVWLAGGYYKRGPSVENCRLAARAFNVPLLNVLIAAGHITRDEAGMSPLPEHVRRVDELDELELLEELRRKILKRRGDPAED
jgi:transcriptional regulator with XRE-family HTH domain